MQVLLVRPKPHKETIGLQSVMVCEPLELMGLKAVLSANGHDAVIVDMILEKRPLSYYLKKHNPSLVAFTGYISHVNVIKEYARTTKKINKNITTAVGGVHSEVCPEDFFDANIDMVCSSPSDLYEFLGCDDKGPMFPDRNLPGRYRRKYYYLFHDNCALIKTSLGCPYNCAFCFCKEIAKYSARDIDDVVNELEGISQEEVYIVDDDFLFDRNRLIEFAEKLQSRNIKKRFLAYGRADFIANNEDIIGLLHKSGLRAVIVGIESASQEELDSFNKKLQIEDTVKATSILAKYGIECYGTVILGIDWGKADFDRLYRFLASLGLVFVNLQPLTPMPQTTYFDQCKDSLVIPYTEHEKWDMAHLVVKPGKLSIRQYYLQITKLYCKLTMNPKSIAYMVRKYGFFKTARLGLGSTHVSVQYLKKIVRG
ncbi:MAG: cobalamin-dependent protein [Eubacteriaceae bacterium]|nr:cobalamin-dependent protein [Eubacteriaceae bacterium]